MGRTVVAIVRTGQGAGSGKVAASVRQAVELAGGLRGLVPSGGLVLIKPNMVIAPPTAQAGICTQPSVCKAVADMVRELGGRPVIAESAACGADTEEAFNTMGYGSLREQGYEVVDLKRTRTIPTAVPGGRILKELVTYELALKADAIISVPVMKTHCQSGVTLSIKNLMGLAVDAEKFRFHRIGLFDSLWDLNVLFHPVFAVVDGLVGVEGMGPVEGTPIAMNLVMAGRELAAVDSIASRVMGFDPKELPLECKGIERGIEVLCAGEIEVVGEPLPAVKHRFVRVEEDPRLGQVGGVEVPEVEGGCLGCRGAILEALLLLQQAGKLDCAKGAVLIPGGAVVPAAMPQGRVVAVGLCSPQELQGLPRYVPGCPPRTADIVDAMSAGCL